MSFSASDLIPILTPPPQQPLRFGQGTILSWDPSDFTGTVDWRGVTLTNVPVLGGVQALGFQPGHVVGLIGWAPSTGGLGSWWIVGRILQPGVDSPDLVVRGSSLIVDGGQIRLVGGDDLVVDGGQIRLVGGGDLTVDGGQIILQGGNDLEVNSGGDIDVNGGDVNVNAGGNVIVSGGEVIIEDDGRLEARHTNGEDSAIVGPVFRSGTIEHDGLLVQGSGGLDIFEAWQTRSDGNRNFRVEADDITLDPIGSGGGNGVRVRTLDSTGSANMIHAGGISALRRVSSAARFKVDARDHAVDPAKVLAMQPRAWRDAGEVEADPDTDRWHVGFVADELDEIGLTEFVDYDHDGRPESITYDRLSVALLAVLKDQQSQIDALMQWAASQGFDPPKRVASESTPLPKRLPDQRADT